MMTFWEQKSLIEKILNVYVATTRWLLLQLKKICIWSVKYENLWHEPKRNCVMKL